MKGSVRSWRLSKHCLGLGVATGRGGRLGAATSQVIDVRCVRGFIFTPETSVSGALSFADETWKGPTLATRVLLLLLVGESAGDVHSVTNLERNQHIIMYR